MLKRRILDIVYLVFKLSCISLLLLYPLSFGMVTYHRFIGLVFLEIAFHPITGFKLVFQNPTIYNILWVLIFNGLLSFISLAFWKKYLFNKEKTKKFNLIASILWVSIGSFSSLIMYMPVV